MATIKVDTLILASGKQLKIRGGSLCISPSLEIGEGYATGILNLNKDSKHYPEIKPVANPYSLSAEDIQEIGDYMISLWLALKDNVRKRGIEDNKIFLNS